MIIIKHNTYAPTSFDMYSETNLTSIKTILIEFLKSMFLIPNALIILYLSFLILYTFALDSSYVCLNYSD